jgi:hypothetical protein
MASDVQLTSNHVFIFCMKFFVLSFDTDEVVVNIVDIDRVIQN